MKNLDTQHKQQRILEQQKQNKLKKDLQKIVKTQVYLTSKNGLINLNKQQPKTAIFLWVSLSESKLYGKAKSVLILNEATYFAFLEAIKVYNPIILPNGIRIQIYNNFLYVTNPNNPLYKHELEEPTT
jgi:hypothetical protein